MPVIVDRLTGQVRPAQIFVGVMGASNFTYVEASWSAGLTYPVCLLTPSLMSRTLVHNPRYRDMNARIDGLHPRVKPEYGFGSATG